MWLAVSRPRTSEEPVRSPLFSLLVKRYPINHVTLPDFKPCGDFAEGLRAKKRRFHGMPGWPLRENNFVQDLSAGGPTTDGDSRDCIQEMGVFKRWVYYIGFIFLLLELHRCIEKLCGVEEATFGGRGRNTCAKCLDPKRKLASEVVLKLLDSEPSFCLFIAPRPASPFSEKLQKAYVSDVFVFRGGGLLLSVCDRYT